MTGRIARALALVAALWAGSAAAQGLFSPVAKVNDSVITAFELDQRARMLELFRFPGDTRAEAITRLIEERLQTAEARSMGIAPTEAELVAGETEFASRADLERAEFIKILGQFGVQPESYRAFVAAGLAWRQVVQARFGATNTRVSEDDVDRALGRADLAGGTRVLLTEIVLRADTPETAAIALRRAKELGKIDDQDSFAAAAARFSIGPSKTRDGELNWVAVESLPAEVQSGLRGIEPGQVTRPIRTEDTVLLFYLRDRRQVPETSPATETLDYATLKVAGGRTPEALANAAAIAGAAQTCDDLYAVAQEYPQDVLTRVSQTVRDVPTDIGVELAKLDPGEQSLALTRNGGQTLLMVMLCDRLRNPEAELVRPQVREALFNQQLGGRARVLLATLKANATVEVY